MKDLASDRSAAGLPDLSLIVLAQDPEAVAANEQLNRVVARQYLVRTLRAVQKLSKEHPQDPAPAAVRDLLDSMDVDAALRWALRPEVTGWTWRSEAATADPARLLRLLADITAYDPAAAAASVRLDGPKTAAGRRSPGAPVPVITGTGPDQGSLLLQWASEGDEKALRLDPAHAHAFASRLQEAADILAAVWPEGLAMAATDIRAFAALGGHRGLQPLNFSVHGLRGLVLTSERPAYMLAQTLVHEATHQRFSGVLDCVSLVRNPKATHYSPFVDAERPLGHILHGILSFINDTYAARRYESTESDPVELARLERYLLRKTGQLRTAEKNLLEVAEPTPAGERLIAGCREAISRLNRE
ncbi:aKG-HExxH-type peptide beta-hydroxylase [uncultured Streptomyces sp.]|uniref:aKG-HExxH-type peptide beta-hydroxylase n=1 Tax=uncultured Streptomyces sp. TaxID=174707 RepID=UPI0026243DD0|nr:HEXXH motif-containing putative peptide modification protein [uncultured Streptomyces sp.]